MLFADKKRWSSFLCWNKVSIDASTQVLRLFLFAITTSVITSMPWLTQDSHFVSLPMWLQVIFVGFVLVPHVVVCIRGYFGSIGERSSLVKTSKAPYFLLRIVSQTCHTSHFMKLVKKNVKLLEDHGCRSFAILVITDIHLDFSDVSGKVKCLVIPEDFESEYDFGIRAMLFSSPTINKLCQNDWIIDFPHEFCLLTKASVQGLLNFISSGDQVLGMTLTLRLEHPKVQLYGGVQDSLLDSLKSLQSITQVAFTWLPLRGANQWPLVAKLTTAPSNVVVCCKSQWYKEVGSNHALSSLINFGHTWSNIDGLLLISEPLANKDSSPSWTFSPRLSFQICVWTLFLLYWSQCWPGSILFLVSISLHVFNYFAGLERIRLQF